MGFGWRSRKVRSLLVSRAEIWLTFGSASRGLSLHISKFALGLRVRLLLPLAGEPLPHGRVYGQLLPTPLRFRRSVSPFRFLQRRIDFSLRRFVSGSPWRSRFRACSWRHHRSRWRGRRRRAFLRLPSACPHTAFESPTRFFIDFQSSSFSDLTRERVKDGRHFTVVECILLAG